jgi:nucleotide-binding universal stress UspA family protein
MYTRILVPLDGSDFADCALPLAAALAQRSEALIDLVHVHAPYFAPSGAPAFDRRLDDELKTLMRARLENTRARIAAHLKRDVQSTWLEGEVAAELQAHIDDSEADLVVMTTHGRGGLSRAWLGRVADQVVRHASKPVLLVRPRAIGVTWKEEPLLRRMLVPLDGSALAESVLDHAVTLATPGETELVLFQVVIPVGLAANAYVTDGIYSDRDDINRRQAAAGEYLEGVAKELRVNGFTTTTRVTVEGRVVRAILEVAEQCSADLIAIATHGRGRAARAVLGSVADRVLRTATLPLLMFRPSAVDIARADAAKGHDVTGETVLPGKGRTRG